jgi:predicted DNA-binding protein
MSEVLTSPNEKYAKVVAQQSATALADAIEAFIVESEDFDEHDFCNFRKNILDSCNQKKVVAAVLATYGKLT